ncbi:MAG: hypothetical protein HYX68_29715 [Planctomycetes bacterium]|nr:hypothetical protein [Planctomycetota bacterium]
MRNLITGVLIAFSFSICNVNAQTKPVVITTPVSPPAWALLQRQLLDANARACREFYAKYFDERGWLLCVERWGGDDGPDDAIENCTDWPILHALGGHADVLKMYKQAWEGHLRQYTLAKTKDVPFARDGMYYKEFPCMFDWLHNGEGLVVFNLQGLSDPYDRKFQIRARRYAGFYLNEDPDAPNWDPKHKIIKSMFTGSRGPLLRKATGLDWAGDPFEVGNRFKLGHGERTYQECLDHFKDYNDIIGDHPQNMLATVLGVNAYMLPESEKETQKKYKTWVLEYADAWLQRMKDNGGIIPTNIGLDGKIGSAAGGKWYGGVYGWGFSVIVPQTGKLAHRNLHSFGLVGFMNAYLLTGNDKYLDAWRKQIDLINTKKKTIDGIAQYPTMFGDKGWYAYTPNAYQHGGLEIYWLSLKAADRKRIVHNAWLNFLEGKNPKYAEQVLRADLERIRTRVAGMRKDTTTPDTRLADDPLRFNPASVDSMIELTMGGLPPKNRGKLLFAQLRYFDPAKRRAGLPQDVAALIHKITPEGVEVTLVNTDVVDGRSVIVQAGGYAEHQFGEMTIDGQTTKIDNPRVTVRLAAGCGARLTFSMRRFVNQPTLALPWRN